MLQQIYQQIESQGLDRYSLPFQFKAELVGIESQIVKFVYHDLDSTKRSVNRHELVKSSSCSNCCYEANFLHR